MSLDITGPIQALWPRCPVPLLQGIIDTADDVFARFGMAGSKQRIVPFMATISTESNGGSALQENLYYRSPARLRQVWPSRFLHKADAELMGLIGNPQALAEAVYAGRMGNNDPGDAWLNRGMGLIQTTGKIIHVALSRVIGIDLEAHPEALTAPDTALLCAVGDFVGICRCLPYCDAGDFMNVSAMVNVGHPVQRPDAINGWPQRLAWYDHWNRALSS